MQDTLGCTVLAHYHSQLYGDVQGDLCILITSTRLLCVAVIPAVGCYGKCEVQSPKTIPKHRIMTIQLSTLYPPHLGFLPTRMVISGSKLVFSISLTGIQILFCWSDMGFFLCGKTEELLDCFVCMFIFSISVFM